MSNRYRNTWQVTKLKKALKLCSVYMGGLYVYTLVHICLFVYFLETRQSVILDGYLAIWTGFGGAGSFLKPSKITLD